MGEGIKTRRGESKGIPVTHLYNSGDECTTLTGGWTSDGYTLATAYTKVNATKNASSMSIALPNTASTACIIGTNNAIDFTGHNTMKASITIVSAQYNAMLRIRSTKVYTSTLMGELFFSSLTVGDHLLELDVSAISGSGFLNFIAAQSSVPVAAREYLVTKVWFE